MNTYKETMTKDSGHDPHETFKKQLYKSTVIYPFAMGPSLCDAVQLNTTTIISGPCASNPCQNGATCFEPTATTYRCQCLNGFTGITCNQRRTYENTVLPIRLLFSH